MTNSSERRCFSPFQRRSLERGTKMSDIKKLENLVAHYRQEVEKLKLSNRTISDINESLQEEIRKLRSNKDAESAQ